jgi:uncharacterized protein (TIGR00369 family)
MKAWSDPPAMGGNGALPRSGRQRHVPFTAHLDIRVDHAEAGEAVVSVELQPHMLNNHGAGHGGVLMTLLDIAMANAALSKIDYAREVVTVDMTVGFMAATSGRLVATGRAVGGGRSICFCEARIEDAQGRVAAQAMGTFRYRDAHSAVVNG